MVAVPLTISFPSYLLTVSLYLPGKAPDHPSAFRVKTHPEKNVILQNIGKVIFAVLKTVSCLRGGIFFWQRAGKFLVQPYLNSYSVQRKPKENRHMIRNKPGFLKVCKRFMKRHYPGFNIFKS